VPPLPRLVASADFERVLGSRSRAVTAHFAVHHLAVLPTLRLAPRAEPGTAKLSTIEGFVGALPVEDSLLSDLSPTGSWIGVVVPKRHARRAVTRALLKRQIYAAAERHRDRLAAGLWIVRVRAPFDRAEFVSAASLALRRAAHAELDRLLDVAAPAAP
jgi:ribonuclease P protein component